MAKWRNKINIKSEFTDNESPSEIKRLSNLMILQLSSIIKNENRLIAQMEESIRKENIEYYVDQLDELKEEFQWIAETCGNEDSIDFSFDTWTEAFNNYLDQLYDLGDNVVQFNNFHDDEKFLWVE